MQTMITVISINLSDLLLWFTLLSKYHIHNGNFKKYDSSVESQKGTSLYKVNANSALLPRRALRCTKSMPIVPFCLEGHYRCTESMTIMPFWLSTDEFNNNRLVEMEMAEYLWSC